MSKIPFKKFAIALLLCGKEVPVIVEKLRTFNYETDESEVVSVLNNIRSVLPPKIAEHVTNRFLLDINNSEHEQWLRHFGVFEIYDYIVRGNKGVDDPPNYFKWCEDCVWAHTYKDVMSLINIFLFNEEEVDSISDIILVKYKKKIGVDAFALYQKIFWDCTNMTAKDAHHYCIPFRDNALIIRQFKSGHSEIELNTQSADAFDGCDAPFNFHPSNYIKWKIGYKVVAPKPKEFLEKVQTDSMFKYYEAMNMVQSVEMEETEGTNDIVGAFDNTKTKRRNVEEMRVKVAKQWLDLYVKAKEHMPDDRSDSDDFFKRMRELELDFDECTEQIANIEDLPDVMEDIKGDKTSL